MKTINAKGLATTFAAAALCALSAGAAWAVNDAPLTEKWAPAEWGAEDKIGAVNRITPELVRKHIGLVKSGRYATLGKVYQPDMPFFGPRSFKLTIPGLPTGGPFGKHTLVYNDEIVASELGQVGTQFDGPGHIGVGTSQGNFFYNGALLEKEASAYGMGRLGVEHIAEKGYVCRGVLLNAAAYHGVEMVEKASKAGAVNEPGIVTAQDVKEMTRRQGIAPIGAGDCVFLHTGWGNLWHPRDWDRYDAAEKQRRAARFNSGEPGFGISACNYLAEQGAILTGADTWGVEAVPGANGDNPFECHAQLQTRRGIWNLENLDFTRLIEDGVSEFLFVWSPLKIKGATGSPGNPIALY